MNILGTYLGFLSTFSQSARSAGSVLYCCNRSLAIPDHRFVESFCPWESTPRSFSWMLYVKRDSADSIWSLEVSRADALHGLCPAAPYEAAGRQLSHRRVRLDSSTWAKTGYKLLRPLVVLRRNAEYDFYHQSLDSSRAELYTTSSASEPQRGIIQSSATRAFSCTSSSTAKICSLSRNQSYW